MHFAHENCHHPPIRVAPAFREEVESVLEQGETLSEFVESAVRASVQRRLMQAEFVRRGMASIAAAQQEGTGVPAEAVLASLEAKLRNAQLAKASRRT